MSKYNVEEINKKIDAMTSICQTGKEEVRALLEVVTGESLRRESKLKKGHVYQADCGGYRVVSAGPNSKWDQFLTVDLHGNVQLGPLSEDAIQRDMRQFGYRFVANSVAEFLRSNDGILWLGKQK